MSNILNNSNSIFIEVEKDGKKSFLELEIQKASNNEPNFSFKNISKKNISLIFDSNINIVYKFQFDDINAEILYLYFIILGIKRFKPKGIYLTLPYLPYNNNDSSNDKDIISIPTHYGFASLLGHLGVSSITTYDLWNSQLTDMSSFYINNIGKDTIFEETFDFFKSSRKMMFIIALNDDDYNLLYSLLSHKKNIRLINCSTPINFNSKKEVLSSFLRILEKNPNLPLYIFDKDIITGRKLYKMLKLILKEGLVKELNIFATHTVFTNGAYAKYNDLFTESKISCTVYTTESIIGYRDNINKKFIDIIKDEEIL